MSNQIYDAVEQIGANFARVALPAPPTIKLPAFRVTLPRFDTRAGGIVKSYASTLDAFNLAAGLAGGK